MTSSIDVIPENIPSGNSEFLLMTPHAMLLVIPTKKFSPSFQTFYLNCPLMGQQKWIY